MSSTYSYWEIAPIYEKQDLVIVGAGIVGLNTAIAFKNLCPQSKVLIVERAYPGMGASTKNAGFACFGSASEILDDIKNNGEEEAFELIKSRWEGLQYLQQLVDPRNMELEHHGSFELFFEKDKNYSEVLDHIKRIESIASSALERNSVFEIKPNRYFSHLSKEAIYSQYEGALNPIKMIYSLCEKARKMGIQILYGHEVASIEKNQIVTLDNYQIQTENIALCTNGFSTKLLDIADLKSVRNQVLISNPLQGVKWIETFHLNKGYLYFRKYGNRLLIGGARDLCMEEETTDEFGANQKIIAYLTGLAKDLLPEFKNLEFIHQWSGILGIGESKKPIIRKISKGIFAGIRLGGMGIAIGSLVGKNLAELMVNDDKMTAKP